MKLVSVMLAVGECSLKKELMGLRARLSLLSSSSGYSLYLNICLSGCIARGKRICVRTALCE